MDIIPVSYIDIRLGHTTEANEVAVFGEIIKKCFAIASKPGLVNTFTDSERALIVRIASELGIEREETLYE